MINLSSGKAVVTERTGETTHMAGIEITSRSSAQKFQVPGLSDLEENDDEEEDDDDCSLPCCDNQHDERNSSSPAPPVKKQICQKQ